MRTTWWMEVLGRKGMPMREIRAIVASRDPVVVRQHLELHRERLDEELALQRRVLERIQQALTARPAAPDERADAGGAALVHDLRR